MMVRSETKRHLRQAAQIIQNRGLNKGGWGGEKSTDPVCVLKAMMIARGTDDIWLCGDEALALNEYVNGNTPIVNTGNSDRKSRAMGALIRWAEAPERTTGQVVNALLRAAA